MAFQTNPLNRIDPPVPLEDEILQITALRRQGLLPNLKPVDNLSRGLDPLQAIQTLTETIKTSRAECEEKVDLCALAGQGNAEILFKSTSDRLQLLHDSRKLRMKILIYNVCGSSPEFRGHQLYTVLQYEYHDLGHDFTLAIKLHLIAKRFVGFVSLETWKAIREKLSERCHEWIEKRQLLISQLEKLESKTTIFAFVTQLPDDTPPTPLDRSDRVRGDFGTDRVVAPYVPSPWRHLAEKAIKEELTLGLLNLVIEEKKKLTQADNSSSQNASAALSSTIKQTTSAAPPGVSPGKTVVDGGNALEASRSAATGSSYKSKAVEEEDQDEWDRITSLDEMEWESVIPDVPVDGEDFDLMNDIDVPDIEEEK